MNYDGKIRQVKRKKREREGGNRIEKILDKTTKSAETRRKESLNQQQADPN
jgi:hypothetical protein